VIFTVKLGGPGKKIGGAGRKNPRRKWGCCRY